MHFILAVCLAMFLGADAWGAGPKAVINGPTTASEAGALLTLDASDSVGDNLKFRWLSFNDEPGRLQFEPCGDGKKCRVHSRPGVWQYLLFVYNEEGDDHVFWTVTVPGTPTPPVPPVPPGPVPPGPVPPVPPAPPVPPPEPPPGMFGIAKEARNWARALSHPAAKEQAGKLADAADGLAARISAGTVKGPRAILGEMLALNQRVLAANIADWKPFGDKLAERMRSLYEANQLPDDASWAVFLRELAIGLRAV